MKLPPRNILYYGQLEALPERRLLRAGPLTLFFEAGALRQVRLSVPEPALGELVDPAELAELGELGELGELADPGEHADREVLRGIYVAVRDRHWRTVPGVLALFHLEAGEEHFELRFDSEHRRGEVHFWWHGAIRGQGDGTLEFHMDGEARSTFLRNRIGLCVLHPLTECVGRACRVEHVNGASEHGEFPEFIAPHQPFLDVRAISHEVGPDLWAEVRFEGDTFEMEDHRNWADAAFKTYGTPLRLPHPVEIQEGTKVRQWVTLRLKGNVPATPSPLASVALASLARRTVRLRVADQACAPLPLIGLGMPSHGQPLSARELKRLKALHLCHLRLDLTPGREDCRVKLAHAAAEAGRLGVPIEGALFLSEDAVEELEEMPQVLSNGRSAICRWLVFDAKTRLTTPALAAAVRGVLGVHDRSVPIGGGTDADFVALNRNPPPPALELVSYPIHPQAHARDNDTLVENLAAQAETVKSARRLAGGRPLVISPVTLRRRYPRGGADIEPEPGEPPDPVDVRQMSLFGAGWTLGSLKYLAESGVHSVTYYETTGWRGVLETEQGSPMPEVFRSIPGAVFPLYHVLADVGEFAGGEVLPVASSEPLRAVGFAFRREGRMRVLLANFTPRRTQVELHGLPLQVHVRPLDEENNAMEAMVEPERFRRRPGPEEHAPGGRLELELLPYAVVRLDGAA